MSSRAFKFYCIFGIKNAKEDVQFCYCYTLYMVPHFKRHAQSPLAAKDEKQLRLEAS